MTDSDNPTLASDVSGCPVLPLRDIVVFPYMIVPLFVGREKSVRALEEVMNKDKQIILVTQREANEENPGADDLYSIGTLGTVLQLLKLPDGSIKVLVEGHHRVEVTEVKDNESFLEAKYKDIPTDTSDQNV
ncbi:MAG: LON peptidase substrate-binding domain-containing protein, partial [Candidatus Puniceispirillales bacterium]